MMIYVQNNTWESQSEFAEEVIIWAETVICCFKLLKKKIIVLIKNRCYILLTIY